MAEILQHDADLQAKDQNRDNVLSYYFQRRNPKTPGGIVKQLLAAGADLNNRNSIGQTPLFSGCSSDSVEDLRDLLRAGANPNAKDQSGWTVLMSCSDAVAVQELLNAGADVNAKDQFGRTALEQARQYGQGEKVRILENAAAGKE